LPSCYEAKRDERERERAVTLCRSSVHPITFTYFFNKVTFSSGELVHEIATLDFETVVLKIIELVLLICVHKKH